MSTDDVNRIIATAAPVRVDALDEALARIFAEDELRREHGMSGWPTGYSRLDACSDGWQREGLAFIVSWASGGKTSFLIATIVAMLLAGCRVLFYSTDMPGGEVLKRITRYRYHLPGSAFRRDPMTAEEIEMLRETVGWLRRSSFVLADERAWSAAEIVEDARQRAGTFDAVVIDTFQSISMDGERSQYESTCSAIGALKALKRDLHCLVLVTVQANDPPSRHEVQLVRDERKKGVSPPSLNSLEGARRFTHEAGQVVIVYRSTYGIETNTEVDVPAWITLAKAQTGETASLSVTWDRVHACFRDDIGEGEESARCLQNVSYSG